MKLKEKKNNGTSYALGITWEVYEMLEDVRRKADTKMSLRQLGSELLKEAIQNIEWERDEEPEKPTTTEQLMKERI